MTISETREKVLKGEVKLREIIEQYIAKIDAQNLEINAYVATYFEEAISRAEEIQKKIDNGSAGKLAGVVMGIKDVISERGKKVTCASKILENFESVYDATVIERLLAEDAIFIGRTNMDEFAMGSTTEYSNFGPVKNPHNTSKVPGGSSGGSAAVIAADLAMTSLGSDTGGSIRQPASYCGVVGLKPTYGRVSRYGLVAYASSFDCIGPFARTVEDAARILEVIAGFDERDNTSSQKETDDYVGAAQNPNKNIKIGVPEEFFGEGLDEEIKAGIEKILENLEADGAELVPIHLPHTKYGIATYYILATAEASSNLARFDGIRYGHRADKDEMLDELKKEETALKEQFEIAKGEEKIALQEKLAKLDSPLIRLYKKSRTEGFGTEVKRRIMLGTYVLSAGYYDAYYGKAQKVRRLIQNDYKEAFKEVDVVVSPTAPTTAFDIGSKVDDPVQMYLNDVYTITANLAGICGISVPAGTHSNGLPYGIQFMADSFQEAKVLNAGRLVELQSI
ncbi:MAG: Asp-tRNA(Asn)/Glu-tRNA(Gln) amidotransferase subunit GatA [Gracilimonas sp.]